MELIFNIFLWILLGLVVFAILARAILLFAGGLALMKAEKSQNDENDQDQAVEDPSRGRRFS